MSAPFQPGPDPTQPPTAAELATWLQMDAVTLRNACQQCLNRWRFLGQLGTLSPDELSTASALGNFAEAYFGIRAIPEPTNYDDALIAARRGA